MELKEQYLSLKEKGQHIADIIQKNHLKSTQEALLTLERMRAEHASIELICKELLSKKDAATLELELLAKIQQEFNAKLKGNAELHQKLAITTIQFEKRKAAYQQFITQANQLSSELASINNKDSLVHNDQDPSCPLCEQNLSASRRKFLKNKFSKDLQFIEHQLNRLSGVIKKLKSILVEQHAQIEILKKEADEHKTLEIKLQESVKHSAKLQEELTQLAKQLKLTAKKITQSAHSLTAQEKVCKESETAQQTILDTHAEYQENLKCLETIVKEGKAIAYNQKQHQEIQAAIQSLEAQIALHAALQAESAVQNQRKKEIADLCIELKEKKKQKEVLIQKMDGFKQYAKEEHELISQRTLLAQRIKDTLTTKELLLQEQGSLQEQQKKIVLCEHEHREQEKAISKLLQTIFDYQTIATATGKDGIQALLIEEAIPEIEHEANYLLSRLTNNQAQIFIESLRDLKKGGTKETLDIKISDPAGIRPYEMFSGGEAFRIDFAIRIAVSKLLARRAGTALQTLIIDEGFGSQDDEGLSNIMDCIHKIQDDFSLIIIVSHLSTMKDQFPVHFMVEKRAQASRVSVIELG